MCVYVYTQKKKCVISFIEKTLTILIMVVSYKNKSKLIMK